MKELNRKQKIVFIIGAILLLLVIFTTPKVIKIGGSEGGIQVDAGSSLGQKLAKEGCDKSLDLQRGMVRGAGIIIATLFAWYALGERR